MGHFAITFTFYSKLLQYEKSHRSTLDTYGMCFSTIICPIRLIEVRGDEIRGVVRQERINAIGFFSFQMRGGSPPAEGEGRLLPEDRGRRRERERDHRRRREEAPSAAEKRRPEAA